MEHHPAKKRTAGRGETSHAPPEIRTASCGGSIDITEKRALAAPRSPDFSDRTVELTSIVKRGRCHGSTQLESGLHYVSRPAKVHRSHALNPHCPVLSRELEHLPPMFVCVVKGFV